MTHIVPIANTLEEFKLLLNKVVESKYPWDNVPKNWSTDTAMSDCECCDLHRLNTEGSKWLTSLLNELRDKVPAPYVIYQHCNNEIFIEWGYNEVRICLDSSDMLALVRIPGCETYFIRLEWKPNHEMCNLRADH